MTNSSIQRQPKLEVGIFHLFALASRSRGPLRSQHIVPAFRRPTCSGALSETAAKIWVASIIWTRLYPLLLALKQIIQFSNQRIEFVMVFLDHNLLAKREHAFVFFGSHCSAPLPQGMQSKHHSPTNYLRYPVSTCRSTELGGKSSDAACDAHCKKCAQTHESTLRALLYVHHIDGEHLKVEMSEEEQIRQMCVCVLNEQGLSRARAVSRLKVAIRKYLEDQSDEKFLGEVLKMPHVAALITDKKRGA
jgi:hypothetical protein